jgi:hypothetical protein
MEAEASIQYSLNPSTTWSVSLLMIFHTNLFSSALQVEHHEGNIQLGLNEFCTLDENEFANKYCGCKAELTVLVGFTSDGKHFEFKEGMF